MEDLQVKVSTTTTSSPPHPGPDIPDATVILRVGVCALQEHYLVSIMLEGWKEAKAGAIHRR